MTVQQEVSRLWHKLMQPKRRVVKRSRATYLEAQGWRLTGSGTSARWDGYYRCRQGSFKGVIWPEATPPHFLIYKPPEELRRHRHWVCFPSRGNDWYSVHFRRVPRDLSSGVLRIEGIINESFSLPKAG